MLSPAQQTILRWRDIGPSEWAREVLGVEPTDQQLEGGRELVRTRRVTIRSGHGCFAPGTLVMCADGSPVAVEDVREGDALMGPDGSSIRTVKELRRGREEMYRFRYSDGREHTFNASHILCLVATNSKGLRKSGDRVTVTVREWLQWGEDKKRCHAVYRSPVKKFFGRKQELPIAPYILGLWLGDGTASKTEITSADCEIVDAWTEYAKSIGHVVVCSPQEGNASSRYNIVHGKSQKRSENLMRTQLRGLGVFKDKHIPEAYKYAPIQDRLELLAGLIDTDGTNSGAGYCFTNANKQMAHEVCWIAQSVGCHATVQRIRKTCGNNGKEGTYYQVTIGRNTQQIPIRVSRKRYTDVSQRPNLHFGIRSVEALGVGDYYGFVLDGDSRFLGYDFTVLHNTGKTSFEAWCVLWFLSCYFPAKIPCTAPTGHQLSDILWAEIATWHRRLKERVPELGAEFDWTAEKYYLKSHPHEAFAVARTSRKENPEALQGFHADNLLFLVDEASGVPEQVFQVGEGTLSTEGAFVVMTANPTRESGYFYDSHHRMRAQWSALHWDGEKSPLVSRAYVETMRQKYGVDSPIYKVRVKGDFATAIDGVIPLELCADAQVRDVAPYGDDEIWGVDVGRFGDDASALAKRRGNMQLAPVRVWYGKNTMQTVGIIKAEYDAAKRKPRAIAVDVIGIGAGVVDRLLELELPAVGINVAESPSVNDQYARLRDELWFKSREWLEARDCKLREDDDELVGELTTPKYSILSSGKKKVEGKDELKKRGVVSPNRADAWNLTFANAVSGRIPRKVNAEPWEPADASAGYVFVFGMLLPSLMEVARWVA